MIDIDNLVPDDVVYRRAHNPETAKTPIDKLIFSFYSGSQGERGRAYFESTSGVNGCTLPCSDNTGNHWSPYWQKVIATRWFYTREEAERSIADEKAAKLKRARLQIERAQARISRLTGDTSDV